MGEPDFRIIPDFLSNVMLDSSRSCSYRRKKVQEGTLSKVYQYIELAKCFPSGHICDELETNDASISFILISLLQEWPHIWNEFVLWIWGYEYAGNNNVKWWMHVCIILLVICNISLMNIDLWGKWDTGGDNGDGDANFLTVVPLLFSKAMQKANASKASLREK